MADEFYLTEQELALFGDVFASFHRIMDLDEMLGVIFTKIKPIINIEGASIALHDPTTKEFCFYRTIEQGGAQNNPIPPVMRFPDDQGIAGWVRESGETALINDIEGDDRVLNINLDSSDFVTRSMICVPLKSRKGFQGVFYALN
ncbi:GAF domain-containing protein, partial [Thermodesulfobacteriota bacterium]